jgi:hypothetical protein
MFWFRDEGTMTMQTTADAPLSEFEAGSRLPAARHAAEGKYLAARKRGGVQVRTLDAQWQQTLAAIYGVDRSQRAIACTKCPWGIELKRSDDLPARASHLKNNSCVAPRAAFVIP